MNCNLETINKHNNTQSVIEYLSNKDHNEDVGCILSDWLLIPRKYNESMLLCKPISTREPNAFEIEQLNLNIANKILVSNKMIKQSKVYHSENYNRVSKSCSYIVKFIENNEEHYGSIVYFLNVSEEFFACIKLFNPAANIIVSNLKGRPMNMFQGLLNNNAFNGIFKTMSKTNDIMFVNVKNIKNKCIIIKTNSPYLFYITDFINENDHD